MKKYFSPWPNSPSSTGEPRGSDGFFDLKKDYPKAPPIGLKPQWLHVEHRITEIVHAEDRYKRQNFEIPPEWTIEKNELLEWLRQHLPTSPYLKPEMHS